MVGDGRFLVIWGVFPLVMDFREVMRTSPSELAHCGWGGGGGEEVKATFGQCPKRSKLSFRITSLTHPF